MIPETAKNRTIEAYRCVAFPNAWEPECVLIDGIKGLDATLHEIEGRWRMFVNVGAEGTETYDELHLYYADSPFGKWHPHRRNPVKSDVLSSRPAGRLFLRAGQLYRPAQICAPRYGAGLSLNRILRISPDEYMEEEVERVQPHGSGPIRGMHTWNRAGDLAAIDLLLRWPRHDAVPARLASKHSGFERRLMNAHSELQ